MKLFFKRYWIILLLLFCLIGLTLYNVKTLEYVKECKDDINDMQYLIDYYKGEINKTQGDIDIVNDKKKALEGYIDRNI